MAILRRGYALVLSLLLFAATAIAANDRPVLVIDPGVHTARISSADADAEGRWAVTGSHDKTVRVWSLADGTLLRTIRLPAGPGDVGKVYAVAMSPDGALIAAGGWTRWTEADEQEQIYLFDRASGAVVQRIEGLQHNVIHLAFSLDGRRLAAVLSSGSDSRISIYDRERDWTEIARDMDYLARSNDVAAAFAPDGRLAATGTDGKIRLYDSDLEGDIRPAVIIEAPGGSRPAGIAFTPDGNRLAVGYLASTAITLLDGRTLATLPAPDLSGIDNGDLSRVTWSRDGGTLFAAGRYCQIHVETSQPSECPNSGRPAVLAWSDAGASSRRTLLAGQNSVMSLVPLIEGDLLVAAADPWLGRLRADGTARWEHRAPQVRLDDLFDKLAVSSDGTLIDFYFNEPAGVPDVPARFDLMTRTLTLDPPRDARTTRSRQEGMAIGPATPATGKEFSVPDINFANEFNEAVSAHRFAIHPDGKRFVLGSESWLVGVDRTTSTFWMRSVPESFLAVNITGDGRLVLAAYRDGTIRWHRMSDGVELLAFMPMPDRTNWVAWTPEGFYAATAGAHGILRWHVNHGWDAPTDSVPIANIPGSFRPAVLPLVLQELEIPRALGLAMLAEHNREVELRTHSQVPPGAQLHLLTIGISEYNETYAKRLRLTYADRDARDLASAIMSTQASLYARLLPQTLLNQDATKSGILRALKTMRAGMERGVGNDLAVVHFSGHGALVDGKLYLLPYEVDARDMVGVQTNGLSLDELRGELIELGKRGRVLVLLDACHSGATTMDGASLAMDSTALRTGLAAANVTVLTSSSGKEVSREDPKWEHGAFTKALIDALTDPTADPDRNGLINPTGLAHYVDAHVKTLTGGAQSPGMEIRFDTTVFASGL